MCCEKYYEIIDLIEHAGLRTCEYQEIWHERIDDLAKNIFWALDLCTECGQKVYGKEN